MCPSLLAQSAVGVRRTIDTASEFLGPDEEIKPDIFELDQSEGLAFLDPLSNEYPPAAAPWCNSLAGCVCLVFLIHLRDWQHQTVIGLLLLINELGRLLPRLLPLAVATAAG